MNPNNQPCGCPKLKWIKGAPKNGGLYFCMMRWHGQSAEQAWINSLDDGRLYIQDDICEPVPLHICTRHIPLSDVLAAIEKEDT